MIDKTVKVYLDTMPFKIEGRAVALGLFDGIHEGHAQIIRKTVKAAKQNGMLSSVMTFSGNIKGSSKSVTTLEERLDILSEFGVDEMVVLDFAKIKDMEPQDFCMNILKLGMNAKALFCGDDFRYGKGAAGTTEDLKAFGREYDVAVKVFDAKLLDGTDRRISSSWIREALEEGDVELASDLMGGRPFSYSGVVIKGRQLGRTLGFPTANIEIPEDKITVRRGVYASLAHIGSKVYPSITNVGKRPTFDDGDFDNAETHIFDFDEDIYGARIKVDLLSFVRPEMKFDDIEALSKQVESDKIMAKTYHAKSGIMSE
ncbi:riboflavin kinase / FMN adenylyltransferase [Oscillospiraceae bacterium]|nr:riboflavin kinase / FMN adenylyltransferase [Oscillospiraceae bacterium]